VITYPAVRQDLAFVVDGGVPAGELISAARDAAPEVREVRFLSEYRGEQIPVGKKSVAVAVSFQSPERTLSNADAAALRERVVDELAERFGAELRA
jgi:phenylalanyl-tRNA synthetase beta chain